MKHGDRRAALALSLLSALAVLLIASTSSPLYATNFWTDTNIYFTIGRGMTQGLMPYTDLFDHKGPLLYMLYALGALVSDTSFFGVFLLEAASLTAMLMLAYETVRLFGRGALALTAVPVTALVTATCTAFNQGGIAEEFILPALMLAVYVMLRRFEEGAACAHPARLYALFGAAMGWTFAIKYTDCGLFFGLALAALLYEWRLRGFFAAFRCGLWSLVGMALVVAPVALYLALGGALGACLEVYFYENMFLYAGEPMSLTGHLYNALAYLCTQSMANPVVAAMGMFGCAGFAVRALLRRRKGFLAEAVAMPLGAGLLLLFTYWGEMAHPYYALVFAALMPLALCPLGALAGRVHGRAWALVPVAALALCAPVCLSRCAAVPLMDVSREDMPQTQFARIMGEADHPTLLDWTSLDQGFYLAAGITPTCRYFVNNNLNTAEKRLAYEAVVASGETLFIVVNAWQDAPGPGYVWVAEASGVFDLGSARSYALYRYMGEGQAHGQED